MAEDLPQVRVLVVDDSVVMRRIVARALERDPAIARTDFAANGRLALAKVLQRRPDVIVLDLEMPELDGFGTLAELRGSHPELPVVLFSSVDERSARATLEALSLGATDFVLKPSGASVAEGEAYVEEHLLPLVKGLATPRPAERRTPWPTPSRQQQASPSAPAQVVVIGVSTGGPDALQAVIAALPADLAAPVLVVQHMPAVFTRLLAERLDRSTPLSVTEAVDGELVEPGRVLVAPGGRHLAVTRTGGEVRVVLDDGPPENSCRPAADVLFRSAAEAYGPAVLAVVMTGMGSDGLAGSTVVRTGGGAVLVQDPDTAVVPSMPESVLDAGLADAALGLPDLAAAIAARTGRRR